MERLTERLRTGEVLMASDYEEKYTEQEWICVLQDRLAAYEDTGLTPEEVSALIKDWIDLRTTIGECGGIDLLRGLAEADKDGRVVVLPCRAGSTVYRLQYIEQTPGRFVVGVAEIKFALIWLEEFGKTVFLTREEAEKALEAKKDGNG